MIDSRLAIRSTKNLSHKMKVLEKNWEDFIINKQVSEGIRTEIRNSWERCKIYDVDPFQKQSPELMDKITLNEITNESELYNVSKPIIDNLYQSIKGTGYLIVLSDNNGRIIYLKGDDKIKIQAQNINFIPGANWSEKVSGSNAIGTSIVIGKPIQILSHEHYCYGVHPWVCSAAPIRDPLTKEIIGVIDLTGTNNSIQPHSLSVVQSTANFIEQKLVSYTNKKIKVLSKKYDEIKNNRTTAHVLALDKTLQVIQGDSQGLRALKITSWQELWSHKELSNLRDSLLVNQSKEHEWEWNLSSLKLKVYIQDVSLNSEIIGYIFCIEGIHQFDLAKEKNQAALEGIIGKSDIMKALFSKVKVIANTNVPILLTGESGTGKEVFATAIHQNSDRNNEPFIAINCGAIPEDLITSELFGYESGAFTGGNPGGKIGKFEEANGGTILLDEIGEMPLQLQVHLLRVLQEREIVRLGSAKPIPIDVRVIAATNKNLEQLISLGEFRSDLYYRLNVVELHIPSLKERIDDIDLLCNYFAKEIAQTHVKKIPNIDSEVLMFFHQYNWPGNIRELMNVMEYAVLFSDNDYITLDALPNSILKNNQPILKQIDDELTPLEFKEKKVISQLIKETNGNISETARRLKIARTTLYRKIKKYSLNDLLNN